MEELRTCSRSHDLPAEVDPFQSEVWSALDADVPQPVGHLPWGHIRTILHKRLEPEALRWYAAAAVEYGWFRNELMNMIMSKTLERTGAAPSNFVQQLVAQDSELPQQIAEDPCNFEFFGLSGEVAQRDLENALTSRITEQSRYVVI